MNLRLWRFSSIFSTAITFSAAFAHLMELPAKMRYDPTLYTKLHRTLYWNFGRVGGAAEILAVLTAGGLALWTRNQRPKAFPSTASAAACLALAHGLYWKYVQPVNTAMLKWPLDAIPSDWSECRDQWEYTHAARAILVASALGALTFSVLEETPA